MHKQTAQIETTSEPSVIHNTFVIERSFSKPPERVFSAFSDAAKKRRWYAESDHHDIQEFVMEFHVGGAESFSYRMNDSTPFPGVVLSSQGNFQDIVPNRLIVTASTMSLGGKRISASLVTIELLPTELGTDLICTHQGAFFEGADGPQMREGGWRSLFDRLAVYLARP